MACVSDAASSSTSAALPIVGTTVARYDSRAEAVKAQQMLKSQGHPGFVTVVNR